MSIQTYTKVISTGSETIPRIAPAGITNATEYIKTYLSNGAHKGYFAHFGNVQSGEEYFTSAGVANKNGDPIKESSYIMAASSGKMLGALVFCKMMEEGLMKATDTLGTYLPEFASGDLTYIDTVNTNGGSNDMSTWSYTTGTVAANTITVSILLTQSFGFAYDYFLVGAFPQKWASYAKEDPNLAVHLSKLTQSFAANNKVNGSKPYGPLSATYFGHTASQKATIQNSIADVKSGLVPLAFKPGTMNRYGMDIDLLSAYANKLLQTKGYANAIDYARKKFPGVLTESWMIGESLPADYDQRRVTIAFRRDASLMSGPYAEQVGTGLSSANNNQLLWASDYPDDGLARTMVTVDPTDDYAPSFGTGLMTTTRDFAKILQLFTSGGMFKGIRYLTQSAFKDMTMHKIGADKNAYVMQTVTNALPMDTNNTSWCGGFARVNYDLTNMGSDSMNLLPFPCSPDTCYWTGFFGTIWVADVSTGYYMYIGYQENGAGVTIPGRSLKDYSGVMTAILKSSLLPPETQAANKQSAPFDASLVRVSKDIIKPTAWKTNILTDNRNANKFTDTLDIVGQSGWYSNNIGVKNNRYNAGEWKMCRDNIKQLKCFKNIPLPAQGDAVTYHPISDDKYIYIISNWNDEFSAFASLTSQFTGRANLTATKVGTSSGYHGFGEYGMLTKVDRFSGEVLQYKTMNEMTGILPDPSNAFYYARFGDGTLRGNMYCYGDYIYLPSSSIGYASVTKVDKRDLSTVSRIEMASVLNPATRWQSTNTITSGGITYDALHSATADRLTKEILVIPPNPNSSDAKRRQYPLLLVATSSHLQYEFAATTFQNFSSRYADTGKIFAYHDKGANFELAWEFAFAPKVIVEGDVLSDLSFPYDKSYPYNGATTKKSSMRIHYPLSGVTKTGDFPSAPDFYYQDPVMKVPIYSEKDALGIDMGDTLRWGYINLQATVTVSGGIESSLNVVSGAGFDSTKLYPVWKTYSAAQSMSANASDRQTLNMSQSDINARNTAKTISVSTGGLAGGVTIGTDADTTGRIVSGAFLARLSTACVRVLYRSGVGSKILNQYEAYALNYWGVGCWGSLSYDATTDALFVPTANAQYMPLEELEMYRAASADIVNLTDANNNYYADVQTALVAAGHPTGNVTKYDWEFYADQSGPCPGMLASREEETLCAIACFKAKYVLDNNNRFVLDATGCPQRRETLDAMLLAQTVAACERYRKVIDLVGSADAKCSERGRRFLPCSIVSLNLNNGALQWFRKCTPHDVFADHFAGANSIDRAMRPMLGANADFVTGVVINGRNGFAANKRGQLYMINLDGASSITPAVSGDLQCNNGVISTSDPYKNPLVNGVANPKYINGVCQHVAPVLTSTTSLGGALWGSLVTDGSNLYLNNTNSNMFGNLSIEDMIATFDCFTPIQSLLDASPNKYYAGLVLTAQFKSAGSLSVTNAKWFEGFYQSGPSDAATISTALQPLINNNKRGRIQSFTKISIATGNDTYQILNEIGPDYRCANAPYSFTLLPDLLVHGALDGKVVFRDVRDGSVVHTYNGAESVLVGPPVVGGVMYLQGGYNKFNCTNTKPNRFLKLLTIDGL